MPFTIPKPTSPPAVKTVSIDDWLNGVVTNNDDGRTPLKGLKSATNLSLYQDGVIGPRPSLTLYGPQPVGTVLGEIFEYKKMTGSVASYWMVSMQNVGGTTNVYIAQGTSSNWTLATGKTYDNTAPAHFVQIQNKVIIMNGVDSLSYLDTSTGTITGYTALTNPASAPTLTTNTGLTGSTFKVYYAITANSTVGETAGSPVLTQNVLTDRDLWNPSTQNLLIAWSAVSGAQSYNVYCGVDSGTSTPQLYLIASGLNSSVTSFTDNGTYAQDLSRPLPSTNSTAGPKASRGEVINSRLWLTGDTEHPFYVWYGGDYGYELDFSPANGGGFTPIGNGTKEIPIRVMQFRDGKGTPQITALCQGSNGRGKRYIISPDSITYGSSTISFYSVTEDNGQDGTDSPDGVIFYNDSLWYPSRDGFKTTGTKPQLQNLLSTDRITNTIQEDISRLNNDAMSKCVGVAFEGRLYWSLPVGSDSNNEIWVLDLDRKGAWMKSWAIAADWLWLYNDDNGITHFCALVDNQIYEFTKSQLTNDSGTAFKTDASSGIIKFSEDGQEWAKLIKVIFTVLRPQGALSFTVSVKTEDETLSFNGGGLYGSDSAVAGWGEPSIRGILGWGRHAWSEVETIPNPTGIASEDIEVEINEEVSWWRYNFSSTGAGTNYKISNITPVFVPIGFKNLT